MVLWKKQWFYTENYGKKKHCRVPKTKRLSFITEKLKVIYQKNEVFEHIYSF